MTNPSVCAVLLTRDRPEMARRAVESFQAQTYQAKRLLVWDTGTQTLETPWYEEEDYPDVAHVIADRSETIGALRNDANSFWNAYPIIVHWDSDDWSHPNRITEQVALLQASGADVVGYNEMLFWRDKQVPIYTMHGDGAPFPAGSAEFAGFEERGEAWLYTSLRPTYAPGTTLMYRREYWERNPFLDLPLNRDGTGEEDAFLRNARVVTESSLHSYTDVRYLDHTTPRMIARIHGGNTMHYNPEKGVEGGSWKRVSEWDQRVREIAEAK